MIADALNDAIALFQEKYGTVPEIHVNDVAYQTLNVTSFNGMPIYNDIPGNPSDCSVIDLVGGGKVINVYVWG